MALGEKVEISTGNPQLKLEIYKGHYATAHGHSNYYIDIANNKANLAQAKAVAKALAAKYKHHTMIDTILCLDGMEVIATCLANELTAMGYVNINSGRDIFILTPEHNAGSQLFFRDNTAPMIHDKFVLIIAASVATGFTVKSAVESINYYGGHVQKRRKNQRACEFVRLLAALTRHKERIPPHRPRYSGEMPQSEQQTRHFGRRKRINSIKTQPVSSWGQAVFWCECS